MIEALKRQFFTPSEEFGPIPFWFWNDELTKDEIIRQIHDFHAKEVSGFVIHPRMGLPRTMPYLSETYMELAEAAVAEAAQLGMRVILYDEGMYPSGAAGGLVVKQNPEYASRGLILVEHPCGKGGERIRIAPAPGDTVISVQAVRKLSDKEIEPSSTVMLDFSQGNVEFTPPDEAGDWALLLFAETFSKGTIRGIHPGQDDGEPDAPQAADLLSPEAMQTFIALTHEKYYEKLGPYFGNTIFAMFTDEPDLLGRGHIKGLKPWTQGFMSEFLAGGSRQTDLPVLWYEAGAQTREIRDRYERTVLNRLTRTYYKPLADWCEAHGIALTGHPAASDDIGLLEHFHIPGQDVVWRFIAPEDGKSLTGAHSTLGKCSSDAARHRSRRRNLNECFGVCGKESGWALNADNMKWYLNWLFVRGVNLICPHAFYYSIRDERRDERPPDVGPNNIWWPHYREFSRYIKRMSWLMTDGVNGAEVAVLAQAAHLPWKIAKPLYEQQIEFNYLEEDLLCGSCEVADGAVGIAGHSYKALLIEDGGRLREASWKTLEAFVRQGGLVIEISDSGGGVKKIGQHLVRRPEEIPGVLEQKIGREACLQPAAESIRISRITKDGVCFYVVVNEGEDSYEGELQTKLLGQTELWRPWEGTAHAVLSERIQSGQSIRLSISRRECLVIAIDPQGDAAVSGMPADLRSETLDLSEGWKVLNAPKSIELTKLTSWTNWEGLEHFSGTVQYAKSFEIAGLAGIGSCELDLGEAHELVRLWINGKEAGVRMWRPYVFDIGPELRCGMNELRVAVTNSLANRYDGLSLPSGLIGPVTLAMRRGLSLST